MKKEIPVFYCDECGEEVYAGEMAFQHDGIKLCESCVKRHLKEVEPEEDYYDED